MLVPSVISVLLIMDQNTVANNYWSNLPLKCHIFLIGNTCRSYCITCVIIRFMVRWVCLEPVTTCWCGSIIKWRHHSTRVLLYCCLCGYNLSTHVENLLGEIWKFLILVSYVTHDILTKRRLMIRRDMEVYSNMIVDKTQGVGLYNQTSHCYLI